MRRKVVIASFVVLLLVSSSLIYVFTPVTVVEKPPLLHKTVVVSGLPVVPGQFPMFANVSIPSNVLSVKVYISMNTTYFINGTSFNPSRVIVGLFLGNNTSWGIKKAGYYQPSLGCYEIIVSPLSYSIKMPSLNPNGSFYDNFTFRGKTFFVGIDPTLNYQLELCSINWVKMKYTHSRL